MQTNVLKKKIDEYFEEEEKNTKKIFEKLSLYIYQIEIPDSDLHILANIVSPKDLSKIISYFDGDSLKLPSKEEHQTCLFLAVCFYLKEVKGLSWEEIKKFIDLPKQNEDLLNTIMLGRKINKIKSQMNNYFKTIIKSIEWDLTDIKNFLDEMVTNND